MRPRSLRWGSVPSSQPLRLAFIGWGAIARTTTKLLSDSPVQIVAVAVRDNRPRLDLPSNAALITRQEQLAEFTPDVVAEAAGRDSVGPWGHAAFEAGADFIVSSVSAFADATLLASLRSAAERAGRQVHIQTGALGGIDALAAARNMGIDTVEHRIVKPPNAWRNTPAETLCSLDALTAPEVFFSGSADEAASAFPKNANVAMTTALAGIGPALTKITLIADPGATTNRHEISAAGAFGQLDVSISNNPLPDNPKTSAMAALSLVRSIRNRVSAVAI
jgi:aspartate dehydrogenase